MFFRTNKGATKKQEKPVELSGASDASGVSGSEMLTRQASEMLTRQAQTCTLGKLQKCFLGKLKNAL